MFEFNEGVCTERNGAVVRTSDSCSREQLYELLPGYISSGGYKINKCVVFVQ